tara:strand:- start:52 stop:393 length:342 start_codon:yes stop_codon:yes gene_type:complete
MYAMPEEKAKYGHDPRDGMSSDMLAADEDWTPGSSGEIGALTNVNQLQAALDAAEANNQLVSLKFVRKGCKACASTVEKYAETAQEFADAGQFYEVDFDVRGPAPHTSHTIRH